MNPRIQSPFQWCLCSAYQIPIFHSEIKPLLFLTFLRNNIYTEIWLSEKYCSSASLQYTCCKMGRPECSIQQKVKGYKTKRQPKKINNEQAGMDSLVQNEAGAHKHVVWELIALSNETCVHGRGKLENRGIAYTKPYARTTPPFLWRLTTASASWCLNQCCAQRMSRERCTYQVVRFHKQDDQVLHLEPNSLVGWNTHNKPHTAKTGWHHHFLIQKLGSCLESSQKMPSTGPEPSFICIGNNLSHRQLPELIIKKTAVRMHSTHRNVPED